MKRLFRVVLITLLLVGGSSCVKRPHGVLSDRKAASLMADLEIAGIVADRDDNLRGDSARRVLRQSVFADHGVTEEQYLATLDWYGRNMDDYASVVEMAANKVKDKQRRMAGIDPEEVSTDAGLWPYGRMVAISPLSGIDNINFSIDVPDIDKGDYLEWRFNNNDNRAINVLFGVDYDDGSKGYVYTQASSNGMSTVTLQTDTAKLVKRLYGMASLNEVPPFAVMIDSIAIFKRPYEEERYKNYMPRQKQWEKPKKKVKPKELPKDSVSSAKEAPFSAADVLI